MRREENDGRKDEKQEGSGEFGCVWRESEKAKEGTRGGERKGDWEEEQMERQTESGEEEKV